MKWLILLIFLIPLSSALNISIDYPDRIDINAEAEFEVIINNSSEEFYDIKIDIIQNDKRISKIMDSGEYKSSMYYLDSGIKDEGNFDILIFDGDENEGAELIVKLRDSSGKVETFRGYEIMIGEEEESIDESVNQEENSEEIENHKEISKPQKEVIEETTVNIPEIPIEIISLNPKAIKTDKSSEKYKAGISKYLFLIFSLILLTLYIIKPRKKKNEFRY